MKNKNLRAKLKQHNLNSSSNNLNISKDKEKQDNNKSSEVEISFNITPEEDELKKSINGNIKKIVIPQSASFGSDISELEKANIENQKQIESLLEKTRSFLEKKEIGNLMKNTIVNGDDDNGIFVKIPNYNIKNSKHTGSSTITSSNEKAGFSGSSTLSERNKNTKSSEDITSLDNYYNIEDLPSDVATIKKIGMIDDKHISKENLTSNNNNSIINNTTTCVNMNSINQRLLEKIKIIKNLEKEVKEKNSLIQKLNSKIDKQKEEILKLNEKLNSEKQAPFIRNENVELHKKLRLKDQELLEKNRIFEEVVGEYKSRLDKVMNTNNTSIEKIKELENVNRTLALANQTIENSFKTFKLNYEKEIKERKNQEEKQNTFFQNFKHLLKLFNGYKNNLTNFNENSKFLFEKINTFFIPEKTENTVEHKNYLLESNLTNSINCYQDEDYMIK